MAYFNCMSGPGSGQMAYRCQIQAESMELALLKFLKQENARVTHIRTRPLCRIAFRQGVSYFYLVYEHGKDPPVLREVKG